MTCKFPENREKYLGMGESAAGTGLMVGPVLGSLIYTQVGYFGAFMFFAALLSVAGVLSFYVLPQSLNEKLDAMSDEDRAESVKQQARVPYSWFFNNRRSLFSLSTCTIVCFLCAFSESYFTPALKEEKGVAEIYHGLIVSTSSFFYVMATFGVGYVIQKLPKRVFMTISFLGCGFSLLLLGPSYILHLPNQLWILVVGQALLGISLGFVFIPVLPEMIDSIYISQRLREGDDEWMDGVISDKAAGLYGSFYSIGMIVAPISGSAVYEYFKVFDEDVPMEEKRAFNKTCDVFAAFTLGYAILYLLWNVLPDIRKDDEQQRNMSFDARQYSIHRMGSIETEYMKKSAETNRKKNDPLGNIDENTEDLTQTLIIENISVVK